MERVLERAQREVEEAGDTQKLLEIEARATKGIYRYVAKSLDFGDFTREHAGGDKANDFLNHGNYLAYGLAATGLWVLGIPHGFPVMHGKTRRGALVFDIADLVKDAIVLPTAFISALRGDREQEFRDTVIDLFVTHKALDLMIDSVKTICSEYGRS
jgi:CRISPR-associated protein Cas1